MNTIHKHERPHKHGPFTIVMNESAKVLRDTNQGDAGVMFVSTPKEGFHGPREFVSIFTGGDIPEGAEYVDTYTVLSGRVAHHIYEVKRG